MSFDFVNISSDRHRSLVKLSVDEAKSKKYIKSHEIPELFEALMAGLMIKQPDDHISYMIECLQQLKSNSRKSETDSSLGQVNWDTFLTARKC